MTTWSDWVLHDMAVNPRRELVHAQAALSAQPLGKDLAEHPHCVAPLQ